METNTIIRKNTHFRCFLYHLEHSPFVDRDPQIKSPFIMVFTLSPAALNIILLLFVSIKKRAAPISFVSVCLFTVSIHLKSVHHVAISFDVVPRGAAPSVLTTITHIICTNYAWQIICTYILLLVDFLVMRGRRARNPRIRDFEAESRLSNKLLTTWLCV